MNQSYSNILLFGLTLSLVACGSEDPADKSPGQNGGEAGAGAVLTESLLPLAEGNTWTYLVTDGPDTFTKTTTVGPEEAVGGEGPHSAVLANRVTTTKKDGQDKTVSWQNYEDGKVKRYREQSFNASDGVLELEEYWTPYRLHVDDTAAHTVQGASWLESYEETNLPVGATPSTSPKRDLWTVQETNATVTVPAGKFDNAIVLVKSGTSTQKTYYYVPGVGKVKELGGQTEELVSFESNLDVAGRVNRVSADAAMTALRDEAKYWVEYGALSELIDQLEAHLTPHRFEGEGASRLPMPRHFVTTVYFDTASWLHLESALATRQDNVKLRFKEYYDEHSSLAELATNESEVVRDGAWVWLELKRREGTRTTKQRLRLSKFEIPKLLARKRAVLALPKGSSDVTHCVRIAEYCREVGEPLEARCVVNYRRLSYQDPPGELRITIDLDLAFFAPPSQLWEEMGPLSRRCLGERLGSEDRALIEVKRRGAFPEWLARVLNDAGARQADFSKFVRAAELVRSHG